MTHEQSLLTCAAYRALASDGRFRRLWMVAALRVAGLKGLSFESRTDQTNERVAPERQNHSESQHSTVAPSIRKAHATNCNHRNIQRRSSAPAGRSKVTLAQLGPIFPRAASAKGASHPWLVTHGLTLRGGQLSWAILNGDERVENRHFRMHPGWYALHTGAKTSSDASQLPLIRRREGHAQRGRLAA